MLMNKVALCLAVVLLATSPAAAQNAPSAGTAGDLQFWEGYGIGTYVIVGGLVFVVVLGGLQLVSGDDSSPTPTPAPPASGSTVSTS